MPLRMLIAMLIALTLFAAACADGDDATDDAISAAEDAADDAVEEADEAVDDAMDEMDEAMDDAGESMDDAMEDMDESMDDAMEDMDESMDDMDEMGDHSGMDMGDPDATPAYDVEGADLMMGDFVVLDTAPEGFDTGAGTAWIARADDGVTVTLEVSDLPPNTEYVSHVHEQSCDDENGGPHFKYDPDGSDVPPNEIHLGFTSDADGNGVMTATNEMVPGDDAMAVVIHPAEFPDNRALCADFA